MRAGDAYELVAQTGGGGGTDDQTAAEVPVTATGFTGNLGSTDTDVQTALETIDGFTLGGGGGGTTVTANPGSGTTDLTTVTIGTTDYTIAPSATAVTAFECTMTDIAATTYAATTNILECADPPEINEGLFVVEDASGTDTTDRVVIQEAGFYELIASVYVESIAATLRTTAHVGFQLERGGTDAVLADEGTGYVRDGLEVAAIDHTSFVELEVGDRIGVTLRSAAAAASIAVDGSKSVFAIIRTGGPEGPRGPAGTGSDIASVDVAYAPDVRVWELTIEQTGGGATFTESTTIPIATQATFGLIEMANQPEVEAGAAINRAIGPSTIRFLDPDQMSSGNASDDEVPTADGAGGIAWEAPSGGATFAIHSLPAETTIAAGDSIPFSDASDSNDPKRITRHNFGLALAGRGIEATATGQLQLDLDGPPLISTVADTDLIPISDASDSFSTKRTTLATLGTHFGTGGGGTTVTANPGTAAANDDLLSVTIGTADLNIADEAARADVDALEDLLGYSGRQELHARPPLPVEELTGSRNRLVRSLGYVDGLLYGFTSEAAGGTVNGTDLLNNRDPQDGGAVGLTPETVPQTLYFFLNGTTLYAQNFNGGGSETTFDTGTIRNGVPYALSTYPDEPGKLYMLIDGGDVYVEELDFNALGTITHAETVATITPAILNTFAAFGGYEDETDVVSDNGGSGGDASGITDIYVSGDYAWFLVTYAEDAAAGADFNYIARFARTDSAITAPATVTDADLVETGIRSDANQNSLVALATDGGLLTDLFLSRASNPIIDHFTNSRLGDYEDLANRPDELTTANVEDATSEIFGLVSGERLEEHTLDAVPDVPIYFDGNMHGDPFDPNDPLGPNVVEFESDSHLNIQYHTDATTTNTATQEIKGNIYSSGDRTFHITSVDMWSGYILNRTYHAHIAVVDTANGDQVTAVYPSATRYHAPSSGRSGVFMHQYTWGSVGIEIPPNTDFAIMLGPVDNQGSTVIRAGAQASDSPTESNPDNSDDIAYLSPATHTGFALHVNNSLTRPSNGFVLGNFKIYYHTTLGG